eukprot:PhM_4_TR15350/c0_g1_i1/m.42809
MLLHPHDETTFFADVFGYLATFLFFVQYIPQISLNLRRKTVRGFSTLSIVIKMFGASFFMANYLLIMERWPTTLYSIICTGQYTVLILQAAYFDKHFFALSVLIAPFASFLISSSFPATMQYTTVLKPITQVLSHIPLLHLCYKERSVRGVSMPSMHLNACGGISGMIMCCLVATKSRWTFAVYLNSFLQAVTVYVAWWLFGDRELASVRVFKV